MKLALTDHYSIFFLSFQTDYNIMHVIIVHVLSGLNLICCSTHQAAHEHANLISMIVQIYVN